MHWRRLREVPISAAIGENQTQHDAISDNKHGAKKGRRKPAGIVLRR
ncbi:MAG: hypothetical protein RL404_975 [Pseudomonadota bacterium]|jgi:hypothetical protein